MTKEFFGTGQLNGTTKYLYSADRLGSIREMSDNSGAIQSQYAYDSFGRLSKLQGGADSDFMFAGYYLHSRSGLNLTLKRAYNANLGRFISRDPIAETGGINLFAYVGNKPTTAIDPLGLFATIPKPPKKPKCKTRQEEWDDCIADCRINFNIDLAHCNDTYEPGTLAWLICVSKAVDERDKCIDRCGPDPGETPPQPQKDDSDGLLPPGGGADPTRRDIPQQPKVPTKKSK